MAKRATPRSGPSGSGSSRKTARNQRPVPPPSVQGGPSAEGTKLFEEAMTALQEHRYGPAAEGFRALIDDFPTERAFLDRSRAYLELCERELSAHAVQFASNEERLTAATAALNNGEEDEAEKLILSALEAGPASDMALYLLAALEARRGHLDVAMGRLGEAVALSPEAGVQARQDPDFEDLYDSEAFKALTNPKSSTRSATGANPAER